MRQFNRFTTVARCHIKENSFLTVHHIVRNMSTGCCDLMSVQNRREESERSSSKAKTRESEWREDTTQRTNSSRRVQCIEINAQHPVCFDEHIVTGQSPSCTAATCPFSGSTSEYAREKDDLGPLPIPFAQVRAHSQHTFVWRKEVLGSCCALFPLRRSVSWRMLTQKNKVRNSFFGFFGCCFLWLQ